MNESLRQLVDETIELTGAAAPSILDSDAPVLRAQPAEIYLVGLVGGKDVGKSSMVNALVGRPISTPTSYGPGTERVVAYAHESAVEPLKAILQSEVPDRYTIITHRIDELASQVLLDLPDIDSKYGDHVQTTRRMLKHMLYPLWIQSVEKYADLRPQELLAAVAEGNDPANFIFCLNKADQIAARDAEELRSDFARRIARVTGLQTPTSVHLVSGQRPDQYDLPALRAMLARQRSAKAVEQSRALAGRRQDHSLLNWVQRQGLSQRAEQIGRLEHDAEEIIVSRLGPLVLEQAIPRLRADPGQKMAMLEPVLKLRLSRWPIINALDAFLSPLLSLAQKNLSSASLGSEDPDAYLDRAGAVSLTVQAAFAQVHQLHPDMGKLYASHRPWEPMHADSAAGELRSRFIRTLQRQREALLELAGGRWAGLLAPIRWLLTIGAVIWFVLLQPILNVVLQSSAGATLREAALMVVQTLSVTHFYQSAIFLLIWFVGLWILLRFGAQSRVSSILRQWQSAGIEEELSLEGQSLHWMRGLLEPIRQQRERVESLVDRAKSLQQQLTGTSPVATPSAPAASRASA